MERETRFELATPALARRCSTAELFPHVCNPCFSFLRLLVYDTKKFRWLSTDFLKIFNLGTTYDISLLPYNGYLSKIGLPPLYVEKCLSFIGHTKRL